jgi:hypothetical protein
MLALYHHPKQAKRFVSLVCPPPSSAHLSDGSLLRRERALTEPTGLLLTTAASCAIRVSRLLLQLLRQQQKYLIC